MNSFVGKRFFVVFCILFPIQSIFCQNIIESVRLLVVGLKPANCKPMEKLRLTIDASAEAFGRDEKPVSSAEAQQLFSLLVPLKKDLQRTMGFLLDLVDPKKYDFANRGKYLAMIKHSYVVEAFKRLSKSIEENLVPIVTSLPNEASDICEVINKFVDAYQKAESNYSAELAANRAEYRKAQKALVGEAIEAERRRAKVPVDHESDSSESDLTPQEERVKLDARKKELQSQMPENRPMRTMRIPRDRVAVSSVAKNGQRYERPHQLRQVSGEVD